MAGVRQKNRILWGILLPFVVIIGIWLFYAYVSNRMIVSMPEVKPVDGVADFRDVPLENGVWHLVNSWDYFAGKLYGPEDFADPDNMPVPSPNGVKDMTLGSYRVKILAKPNTYLAIASFSIDYSMRVYVDGVEVRNYGNVSADPDEVRHGARYMVLPLFTGEDGEVEIIYQYANFMHNDGGFIPATTISTPENIDEYVRGMTMYSLFLGCGLLFIAFYFFVYAVYQRSREYFMLAACCFLIAFRNSFFAYDYLLKADFPFELRYRLFILTVSLLPSVIVFLPSAFFPQVIGKKQARAFTALYAVLGVLHFTLHTKKLVGLCHISYYICVASALAVVAQFIWYSLKRKKIRGSDLFTLVVVFALFFLMLWEGINTSSNSLVAHFGLTPYGFLLCILGLSISTSRKIRIQAEQLAEEMQKNEVLGQTNAMNRSFLQTVAHELRTPLSVISGYAQLTEMQIQKGKLSPQTPERLQTIRSEADRLGAMVANLMAYTYGNARDAELHMVDPKELLHNAALIAEPVCEKKNNRLVTACETGCMLHGNFELLLQVLINMIVNASRHTDDGEIRVTVAEEGDMAVFTVADTGTGIAPNVAEHIFERGYTTDGGNGLGLAICMDTVHMHGGDMTLAATGPGGTTFRFTIPKEKEV
jgi:signal transduction histidine kinase